MSYYGYWGRQFVENAGNLVVSGANTLVMEVGRPIDIKRIVLVNTVGVTVASAKLTIGKRNADGSSSVTHSAWTLPVSTVNTVHEILVAESLADAAGSTAVDGLTTHDAGNDLLEVKPGEEFFITSDGGSTAGAVDVFVQYQEQGVTGTRYVATKLVETTP